MVPPYIPRLRTSPVPAHSARVPPPRGALGMTLLLSLSTCAALCTPQAPLDDRAALAQFDGLPVLRQVMLVRRAEQRLRQSPDPSLRRILALRVDEAALPESPAPVHFDPDALAPGVAPKRRVIAAGDPRHRAVLQAMPSVDVLPDLARGVRYDWRLATIVKAPSPSWRARFQSLLRGYPPNADAAYARVLAALDEDIGQRPAADYFEHTYADRNGNVYEGISLYQAWYAGATLEMPDVDVIAFAVRVLGDGSFVSPIPADARRQRLYATIEARALAYRQYRTMLQAAAAAFVCAEPEMDPMYARLAARFHYLFSVCDDDLARVRDELARFGGREALIEWVDGRVVQDAAAMAVREGRRRELSAMAETVRDAATAALAEERASPPTTAPGHGR